MVHAHFRADVSSKATAEEALANQPTGTYLIYQVSDKLFILSYVSDEKSNQVQHVILGRLSQGAWCIPESTAEDVIFPSLSDLLISRQYLKNADGLPNESDASRTEGGDAAARESSDIGGLENIPEGLESLLHGERILENENAVSGASEAQDTAIRTVVVPPSCPHSFQNALFVLFSVLGMSGITAGRLLHQQIGPMVSDFVGQESIHLSQVLEKASLDAASTMLNVINNTAETSPQSCGSVAVSWREQVCMYTYGLQARFEDNAAWFQPTTYLIGISIISACLLVLLLFVHTGGKTQVSLQDVIASSQGNVFSMRSRWGITFTLLFTCFALSTFQIMSYAWDMSGLPTQVSHSVRPFLLPPSMNHPQYERYLQNLTTPETHTQILNASIKSGNVPWRVDDFGAALLAHRVPVACARILQQRFSKVFQAPAILRIHADILDRVLGGLVEFQPGKRDCFDTTDPFPDSGLAGWFDFTALVLPTNSAVARSIILMIAACLTLLLFVWIGTDIRQKQRAVRVAAPGIALSHEHED